jgi:hypothetical protein
MSVIGVCKLCLREGVELRESHLLPAYIYRKIRRSTGAKNSLVMATKKSFRFTDKQITDHLMCADCEQRFGEVENWVSLHCLQDDGSFPLRDALNTSPLLDNDPEVRAVSGRAAGIDAGRYAYFAASILWRGGVHVWGKGAEAATIDLGRYEEQFRVYLLGQAPFPEDAAVGMFVAVLADIKDQFATTPVPLAVKGYHHYEVVVPGIQFAIMIGKQIPEVARMGCILRSVENLIFLTDHLNQRSMKALLTTARVTDRVRNRALLHKH